MSAKHVVHIERWNSEKHRDDADDSNPVVRWVCRCGRLGPGCELGKGDVAAINARRTAHRGGESHISRWTR